MQQHRHNYLITNILNNTYAPIIFYKYEIIKSVIKGQGH